MRLILLLLSLIIILHAWRAAAVSSSSSSSAITGGVKDVAGGGGFAALDLEEELRTCRRDLVLAASELPVQRRLQNELTECRRERDGDRAEFEAKKTASLAFWERRFAELSENAELKREEEIAKVREADERLRDELRETHVKEIEDLTVMHARGVSAYESETSRLRDALATSAAEAKASLEQCQIAQKDLTDTFERRTEEAVGEWRGRAESLASDLQRASETVRELSTGLEQSRHQFDALKSELERTSYEKELLNRRLESYATDARVVFEAVAMRMARYCDNWADFINTNVVVELQRRARSAYLAILHYDYRAAGRRLREALERDGTWLKSQAEYAAYAIANYDYKDKWISLVTSFDTLTSDISRRGKARASLIYRELDSHVLTPASAVLYEGWFAFMSFYVYFRAETLRFLVSNPHVPPAVKANVEPIVNYTFGTVFAFTIFLVWLKLQQAFLWLVKTLCCSRWFRASNAASGERAGGSGRNERVSKSDVPREREDDKFIHPSAGRPATEKETRRVTISEEPAEERVATPATESPVEVKIVDKEETQHEEEEEGEEEDIKKDLKNFTKELSHEEETSEEGSREISDAISATTSPAGETEVELLPTNNSTRTTRSSTKRGSGVPSKNSNKGGR